MEYKKLSMHFKYNIIISKKRNSKFDVRETKNLNIDKNVKPYQPLLVM